MEKEVESIQKKELSKLTPLRIIFNKKYGESSESEIQKEILYTKKLALDKLENIRKNTTIMVWFLIIIPVIISIVIFSMN